RPSTRAEGAAMTLDSAGEFIRRTRGRRARADRGRASLTAAEAAVAKLAAEGLRNPAIAEQLVVARGTVKVHLSRVYAKLGVANRTQLAVYLRESPERRAARDSRIDPPGQSAQRRTFACDG
ncbi:response regulator transcription factor, partial [Yinghuangia sp. YIM S10712]|uniref:response regulator transcription factor n=1 Tax=Yinghuangia sp. YIM S10712 TaxID=3436930 RepID=UPI003F534842